MKTVKDELYFLIRSLTFLHWALLNSIATWPIKAYDKIGLLFDGSLFRSCLAEVKVASHLLGLSGSRPYWHEGGVK